jgi:hypothetical protein
MSPTGGMTAGMAGGGGGSPGGSGPPPGDHQEIVVSAGELERTGTVVSFPWPGGAGAARTLVLDDAQGGHLPLQIDEQGRATFILPSLKAGASATYVVGSAPPPAPETGIAAAVDGDTVKITSGASTVLLYQTKGKLPAGIGGNFLRGGYIHPLYSPAGLVVTDDYPGDHRHHHGIWSAWAHSTFEGRSMDFWNMGGGSAKVDFASLAGTWSGPVHAGLRAKHVFVDLKAPGGGKTALNEEWVVTAYRTAAGGAAAFNLFDIDSTQEAASASPVMLETYLYGGFAFRGSAQWRSGATFLTSEGKDRGSGDGSTGRWCYIGGAVDGKMTGYAVLGHPGNFRAPQPMRLNPTDPYFSFSPVKMGGFAIVPGKPYPSRFRFAVTDGAPDKALIDRLWNDYARPPEVMVRPASK